MEKHKKYKVRLVGRTSFPGVGVPGSDVIVTKEPTILMEAQRDALLEAIGKGGFPVSKDNLAFEAVEPGPEAEAEVYTIDVSVNEPEKEPPAKEPTRERKRTRKKPQPSPD